jgi:small subunit ribosomal protein S20
MANHKSAQKAARKTVRRTVINKSRISRIRTFVKKAEQAVESVAFNADLALETIVAAERELMRGVRKGVILQNTASRKVSRIVHRFKLRAS